MESQHKLFKDAAFGKDVSLWLQTRATDADRDTFQRLMDIMPSARTQTVQYNESPMNLPSSPNTTSSNLQKGWRYGCTASARSSAARYLARQTDVLKSLDEGKLRPSTGVARKKPLASSVDTGLHGFSPAEASNLTFSTIAANNRDASQAARVSFEQGPNRDNPSATSAAFIPPPSLALNSITTMTAQHAPDVTTDSQLNSSQTNLEVAAHSSASALLSIHQLPRNIQQTTSQAAFGLPESEPELFRRMVEATAAKPKDNATFRSAWGDSLKAGSDEAYKEQLKTTYNIVNQQFVERIGFKPAQLGDQALAEWFESQKLYYSEILSPEFVQEFEAAFKSADEEQKKMMVETIRQLYVVATCGKNKPVSHLHFNRQYPLQPAPIPINPNLRSKAITSSVKFQPRASSAPCKSRSRTNAAAAASLLTPTVLSSASAQPQQSTSPAPVSEAPRPCTASAEEVSSRTEESVPADMVLRASSARHAAAAHHPRAVAGSARASMLASKVPMGWGSCATLTTTYTDMFRGAHPTAARGESVGQPSTNIYQFTSPFGAVNTNVTVRPMRSSFPVPGSFMKNNHKGQ